MRKMRFVLVTVVCGLFKLSAGAATPLTTIDDFIEADQSITYPEPGDPVLGSTGDTASGSSILGGSREVSLEVTGNLIPVLGLAATATVDSTLGTFRVENPPSILSVAGLTYDSIGAGLGGVDLTAGGANALFMLIEFVDPGAVMGFELTDLDGDVATLFESDFTIVNGNKAFDFQYSDFTNAAAVDFTSIDKLEVSFQMGDGLDATIDLLGTAFVNPIPEPSSALLIFSAGFMALRRRRRP